MHGLPGLNGLETIFYAALLAFFFLVGMLFGLVNVIRACENGRFPQSLIEQNTKKMIQRNFRESQK